MRTIKNMVIWLLIACMFLAVVPAMAEDGNNVTYSIYSDEQLTLRAADFEKVSLAETGENLSYIMFEDIDAEYGSLWYDYEGKKEAKVDSGIKYLKSSTSSSAKLISSVSFIPKSTFEGEAEINYTGYTTKGTAYEGKILVTVTVSVNLGDLDKLTYYVEKGGKFNLEADAVSRLCRNVGFTLSYIKFTVPDKADGKLYHGYKSASSTGKAISATTKYYKSDSSSYNIDSVTYVAPKEIDASEIEINYTAYDSKNNGYSGIIRVKFDSTSYEMLYEAEGGVAEFKASDFNDKCVEETGAKLSYVKFTLPSNGSLYYDYFDEEDARASVKATKEYYYNKSPYLYLVSFVPKSTFEGIASIDYVGYNVDGESFNGTINVRVEEQEDLEASDIKYSIKNDSYKTLSSSALNSACKKATGAELEYVKFSKPSNGNLYYKYTSNGKYDDTVSSSDRYYVDEADYIKYVSYVPKSTFDGTATISYTGYSVDGDVFTGKIKISVSESDAIDDEDDNDDEIDVEVITYTMDEDDEYIELNAKDFNNVCKDVLGDGVNYIKFTIPAESQGSLVIDFDGDDEKLVNKATKLYYDEDPAISDVSYVPAKSGSHTLKYKAYSKEGETFEGTLIIKVTNAKNEDWGLDNFNYDTAYRSGMFIDVNENEWYGANKQSHIKNAVRLGLMEGMTSTTFGPQGNMTVAQAITIAARIANIYYADEMEFKNGKVKWYSEYLEYVISKKIIDEEDFSNYDAKITRSEMAYIFANILPEYELTKINTIKAIPDMNAYDANYSEIKSLYEAGVLTGSDSIGTFNPDSNITRAEVSAIITRIVDASKRVQH